MHDLSKIIVQFDMSHVPVQEFPFKYVGLFLHYKKISEAQQQPVLDKIPSKLQ